MLRRSIAALALATAVAAPSSSAETGEPAPDFTKDVLGGGQVSLSDYQGRVVVIFLLGHG